MPAAVASTRGTERGARLATSAELAVQFFELRGAIVKPVSAPRLGLEPSLDWSEEDSNSRHRDTCVR